MDISRGGGGGGNNLGPLQIQPLTHSIFGPYCHRHVPISVLLKEC